MSRSAGADGWEDSVATYCLSLGVQFGFQTFASRKTTSAVQWFPSTTFIATHTLTETLRDVASRTTLNADPEAPPAVAGLACAVRELHGTIFQPYDTWLKAAKLRPIGRRSYPQPNAKSLHVELADLALYWLIFSEAANLRHTPEMIWFIFYCAQRSWQAKQVLRHLRLHQAELAELPHQPWMQALGPGIPRAVQSLHDRFRRSQARSAGGASLFQEATLKLPSDLKNHLGGDDASDVDVARMYAQSAASAVAAAAETPAGKAGRGATVKVTVHADGEASRPDSQYDASSASPFPGSGSTSPADDARVADVGMRAPRRSRMGNFDVGSSSADGGGGVSPTPRRTCPESPCLPLPPSQPVSTPPPSGFEPRASSAFASHGAAAAVVSSSGIFLMENVAAQQPSSQQQLQQQLQQAQQQPYGQAPQQQQQQQRLKPHASAMTDLQSTPRSPMWDARLPVEGYKEMLLRLCPDEAAVAAALAGGEEGSKSSSGGGGSGGEAVHAAAGGTPFLTRVVQPLFLFLTEQVYELGQARRQGLESAVRIGYDDVSESMAHPRIVAAALAALPWAKVIPSAFNPYGPGGEDEDDEGDGEPGRKQGPELAKTRSQRMRLSAAVHEEELYWSRLLALSDLPAASAARIPWQGDMAHYRNQLLKLLQGGSGSSGGGAAPGRSAAKGPAGASEPRQHGGQQRATAAAAAGPGGRVSEAGSSWEDGDLEAPNMTVEQAAQAAAAEQALGTDASAELGLLRRANAAADWWARHVLRKTFVEHRSLAMPLVAFARVYQFQLIWFYLLCVWSWSSHENMMHWVASAAALHWGTNCLLWTMQAVLSMGPKMKRAGSIIPFFASRQGRPRRRSGPAAPFHLYSSLWWFVQLVLLTVCWAALAAGLYIAFIVWPHHDLNGLQCYPLLWGHSCYWWIAVVYGGILLCYEVLYRQFNCGGYTRSHLYDAILRLLPNSGTASASSPASPMYDPATFLRTGLSYIFGNAALWAFALGLKFVIDYFIIVKPAGPRLREIMETDKLAWSFTVSWPWWPEGWSRHFTVDLDPCMAAAQVIVLFLLTMVSSGVSYSVATAIWGAVQGVYQGLGSVRHWRHIRVGFHRVQAAMRAKLLTTDEGPARETSSWPLRLLRALGRALLLVLLLPYTCAVGLLRWSGCLAPPASNQPKSWVQREETLAITAPFWNAVVRSMRGRDLLSDKEAGALSFTAVSLSPAAMMATWRRAGSNAATLAGEAAARQSQSLGAEGLAPKETYLPPIAVYVAQIPNMVISGSTPTAEQLEVLQEAYLYLLHLLVAVGAIPRSEQAAMQQTAQVSTRVQRSTTVIGGGSSPTPSTPTSPASPCPDSASAAAAALCPDLHKDNFHPDKFTSMRPGASSHRRLVARRELLGAVVNLVRALVETGKAFKDTAGAVQAAEISTGGSGSPAFTPSAAAATRSRAIDKLCMSLHALGRCMTQMHDLPWNVSLIANRVVVRQYFHQPAVKAVLTRGFHTLVNSNRNNATAWGAEHMPSYEDFAKVSSWLLAILRPTDEGTAPSNSEAVALLADFCSGALHPRLPTAPRVDAMRSVSTLIPHYQETVLYAMSSADARRVLERAGATTLEGRLADDEVLFKNDEGAPSEMLQYLVSEFPDEFRNLLERCRTLVPLAKDEPPYTLEDFLLYGRLYEHRAQLLLWASFRGQVLARTVDGMSMYRTALAMQAVQDAMTGRPQRGAMVRASSQKGRTSLPQSRSAQAQQGGQASSTGGPVLDGRLRLSGVQRMMVQGILRDTALSVEELVAQLVDVIPDLGPLLERKYSLVVSSQVFAKMAASKSLPDRWRAHGIALLATRYSALRVAYLEQDGDPLTLFKAPDFTYRVVHQASVLVRAVPLEREVERRRQAKADRAAAAAAAAAACGARAGGTSSPATTAQYGTGPDGVAAPPSRTASWMDMYSVAEDGEEGDSDSDADGEGQEDGEDAGAALRVWRRRHLLKNLQAAELEVLFRQQLPVNYYDRTASGVGVILGEGKPENQNSALVYCPGVLLQTIDMNQDNSLAQAFKLRNATREFEPLGAGPQKQHVAVLGYPEWIFSYRCGLLADLAAATERTFGTQIQRVMAYPSGVRAHYGHPDLWNKLFSMTRGGVSKANAVQHVSEDVFGGYNALKRGGLSKYVSYISVGKGRDMGLDSILGFEGKISKGCAEQLMSRDLRFLGGSTDFFRSMSLYFTVPGHFINTWLTVLTIQLGVWVQLLLLLGGVGKQGSSMASAMGAVQILQLGTMPLVGFIFNLWLESGLATALATLARQFVAGGLLFHIFRSVTSAFHLGRAVLFGGASYVATGRGFSLRRKTFTQVYCNYSRSHLYLGADILLMVILILVVGNNGGNALPIPAAALWSPLLVAAALLAGPFWFTPYFFRLNQVLRDAREFRGWVAGSAARGVSESWPEWNASQLSSLRDDAGAQVRRYRFWSTTAIVVPRAAVATLSTIVAVTGARFGAPPIPDLLWVLGGSVASWVLLALVTVTRRAYLSSGLEKGWRWVKGGVQVVSLGAVSLVAVVCLFMERKGLRFSGILITLYANYQVASLLVCICVVWLPKTLLARSLANTAYRQLDAMLGSLLCAVLIVMCFIGEIGLVMLDKVQTLVQFNDRYSHSQAARPYAGDDDPAVAAASGGNGGGGGGGGAGLAAAAAAALRRGRAPSNLMVMVPPPPRSVGGGAGGGSRTTGGGAGGGVSGSPSVIQGWVSPRYRGGGTATPVFMFAHAAAGASTPKAAAADGPPAIETYLTSPPSQGTPASATGSAVSPPGAAASSPPSTNSTSPPGPAASQLSVASPRPSVSRQSSSAYRTKPTTSVGGMSAPGPLQLPSRDISWSSSAQPSMSRYPSGQAGGSSSGLAFGRTSVTSPSPSVVDAAVLPLATPRLPPVTEWREVAAAAAEVAVSRATSQPLPDREDSSAPSSRVTPAPAYPAKQHSGAEAPSMPLASGRPRATSAVTPAPAPATAVPQSAARGSSSQKQLATGAVVASPWATPSATAGGAAAAGSGRDRSVSPRVVRRTDLPAIRPRDPSRSPVRLTPQPWQAAAGAAAAAVPAPASAASRPVTGAPGPAAQQWPTQSPPRRSPPRVGGLPPIRPREASRSPARAWPGQLRPEGPAAASSVQPPSRIEVQPQGPAAAGIVPGALRSPGRRRMYSVSGSGAAQGVGVAPPPAAVVDAPPMAWTPPRTAGLSSDGPSRR